MNPADIVRDAATFRRWWQRRDLPHDRAVVRAAIAAGLARSDGGLLFLTEAGKSLARRDGGR